MNFFQKPIFTSLSPNTEKDDQSLAFKVLFSPEKWKKGKEIEDLEKEIKKYLGVRYVTSFNSGRSAFMAILNSLGMKRGSEVLLQAFTCNAAVNPILWSGLKPVFVECDESFNLDPRDLKKKITKKSKAVVVQHTFGQPANLKEIKKICKEKNLYLIEDCAHSLGATYQGKKIGTIGDVAFFSFSRDKIISSVYGGVAVTNNKKIYQKINNYQKKIDYPLNFWIFQQLLHPLIAPLMITPLYRIPSLGKIILQGTHFLGILSKSVHRKEKIGEKPPYFPKKLPNALAILGLSQFKKLDKFYKHRRKIANVYLKEFKGSKFNFQKSRPGSKKVFMRFPLLLPESIDSSIILEKMRAKGVFLDDGWRKSPIVPSGTDLEKMKYLPGSCPRCEEIAKRIVNLPTHINISGEDARKIAKAIKKIIYNL